MRRKRNVVRLVLAFGVLSAITLMSYSADDEIIYNKATPRAISVTSRLDLNNKEENIANDKMIELLEKNRYLTKQQFAALFPLLVQTILEECQAGGIYKASNKDPDKIYVDIPIAYAVLLKDDLLAELIDADGKEIDFFVSGKLQKTWIVWRNYPTYLLGQYDDVVCDGCPVVDRTKLEQIGITLHLFQEIDQKKVTLAKIPLYPYSENVNQSGEN